VVSSEELEDTPRGTTFGSHSSVTVLNGKQGGELPDEIIVFEFLKRFVMISSARFKMVDIKAAFHALPKKFTPENIERADLFNFMALLRAIVGVKENRSVANVFTYYDHRNQRRTQYLRKSLVHQDKVTESLIGKLRKLDKNIEQVEAKAVKRPTFLGEIKEKRRTSLERRLKLKKQQT